MKKYRWIMVPIAVLGTYFMAIAGVIDWWYISSANLTIVIIVLSYIKKPTRR